MSYEKKFLDQEGVEYLWSKISMEDYPNNETFIAILNAIDDTKADKKDITQSDWNQNDETAIDYIKNKPFYDNIEDVFYDDAVILDEYGGISL